MPKFCPKCGHQAKELAKFCPSCGTPFPQRAAQNPVPPVSHAASNEWRSMDSPAPGQASAAGAPPQYWESYDYPSSHMPGSPSMGEPGNYSSESREPYSYRPPADASRPLPPLSFEAPKAASGARDRAREIARNFSLWSAGIVLFPVPFSDLVLLMPVQTAMVISIGKAYGVKDPPERMLAHIAAACGASVFGQITTLFLANMIPIMGKLISAPFVYGWTYGLGEVAMRYFESQGQMSHDELKSLFKQVSKEATRSFRPGDIAAARDNFDHLKSHLSEDDYKKLRSRFGQS
jgi:uncharacterized protein (DUF697 family)